MKVNLKPAFLISFFALVFLLHELHDWAHLIVAEWMCHCWSFRVFDGVNFCPSCDPGSRYLPFVWAAGPLVTYLFIWYAMRLMRSENPLEKRSWGFCLLFAALPFRRMVEVLSGRGDEIESLSRFFLAPPGRPHYHYVVIASVLLVLLLTLPPLIRAFLLLPGTWSKVLVFPSFFLIPYWIDHWVVHVGMNRLLERGFLKTTTLQNIPLLVVCWTALLLVILSFTYRAITNFLDYTEGSL